MKERAPLMLPYNTLGYVCLKDERKEAIERERENTKNLLNCGAEWKGGWGGALNSQRFILK